MKIRVLYSYPHKLGADRICSTAWEQVKSLSSAGAEVLVMPGAVHRSVPDAVAVQPTLSRGRVRIPYRLLGRLRSLALHDWIVARRLEKMRAKVDIVHAWPVASLLTLRTAARLGIPTVLERPNAHTRYAYESVNAECNRLGIVLPRGHEYEFNNEILTKEEKEYREASRILCPSEFVRKTFRDKGFPDEKLVRHFYGVDTDSFYPGSAPVEGRKGLIMLFAGVCAVRKGVHFALEAWLRSPAHKDGTFLIAGEFLPEYARTMSEMLEHPSVRVLGHRKDIPNLMRQADILVLPSIEEGFGLVCTEAMASGCVPLVSEACTDLCEHKKNSMVHSIGDVGALTEHITELWKNRELLSKLRSRALEDVKVLTWPSAGMRLFEIYRDVLYATRVREGLASV